jgi:hypothetical protein
MQDFCRCDDWEAKNILGQLDVPPRRGWRITISKKISAGAMWHQALLARDAAAQDMTSSHSIVVGGSL